MAVVTCACGGRFRAADRLAGATVPCPRCGAGLTIPVGAEIVLDSPPTAAPTQESGNGTHAAASASAAGVNLAPVIEGTEEACSYHDPAPGLGPFLTDCGRSLLFFAEPHNLMVFVVMAFVFALRQPLMLLMSVMVTGRGMIAAIMFSTVIGGAIAAFLISVVEEAAGGQERLAELSWTDGYYDGFVAPFGRALAVLLVTLAPVAIFLIESGTSWRSQMSDPRPAFLIVLGFSAFIFPMVTLVVAMGGARALARVDLLAATLVRTIIPYSFTALLVAGAVVGMDRVGDLMRSTGLGGSGSGLAYVMVADVLRLYGLVVAMRIIGLYYFHFKERFAWSWG